MLTEVCPCNALLAARLGGRAQNLAAESHTARKHTTPPPPTPRTKERSFVCVCVLHVKELKKKKKKEKGTAKRTDGNVYQCINYGAF